MQGRNIEDVISEWNSDLERQSTAFVRHAGVLAGWDRTILGNRRDLLALEEEIRRVAACQQSLERKVVLLETHQKVRN